MNPESETHQPTTPEEAEALVRGILDKYLKEGMTDEVMGRKFDEDKSLNELIQEEPERAIELVDAMFNWHEANGT